MSDWMTPEEQRFYEEVEGEFLDENWVRVQVDDVWPIFSKADARIRELEAQLERERMRLAACGVIALANTLESAAHARKCKPEYWSASAEDVARAVDREMLLREKLASVTKAAEDLIAEIDKYNIRQPLCDTNIHWFKRLLREACE